MREGLRGPDVEAVGDRGFVGESAAGLPERVESGIIDAEGLAAKGGYERHRIIGSNSRSEQRVQQLDLGDLVQRAAAGYAVWDAVLFELPRVRAQVHAGAGNDHEVGGGDTLAHPLGQLSP